MGAVHTIGDFIRSVFPTIVNKNGTIFKALLADKENNDGTIETVFSDVEKARKAWAEHKSVYKQSGEQLQRTLRVFSVIKPLQNESEQTFKDKNELLFVRDSRTLWGNKRDVLQLFKSFCDNQNVYLVNNTEPFADNLLADGNFEKWNAWFLVDASYERKARFEETTGVFFNGTGSCSQSVHIEKNATYFLHFFMKGSIHLQITDNNGRYWNSKGGEDSDGAWVDNKYDLSFTSADWDNKSAFFFTDSTVSSITVTFLAAPSYYAFLDYVRLNKKTEASTFSLIAVSEDVYAPETASLAPGENDYEPDYTKFGYFSPGEEDSSESLQDYDNMTYADERLSIASDSFDFSDEYKSIDYDKASYFDSTYIYGGVGRDTEQVYQEILDIVQAGGVTSMIELLTREKNN